MSADISHTTSATPAELAFPEAILADRVYQLEQALRRMLAAHDSTVADSEGHWPQPDHGCIECTLGCVPNRLNTGLCAYHAAKRLLGVV